MPGRGIVMAFVLLIISQSTCSVGISPGAHRCANRAREITRGTPENRSSAKQQYKGRHSAWSMIVGFETVFALRGIAAQHCVRRGAHKHVAFHSRVEHNSPSFHVVGGCRAGPPEFFERRYKHFRRLLPHWLFAAKHSRAAPKSPRRAHQTTRCSTKMKTPTGRRCASSF